MYRRSYDTGLRINELLQRLETYVDLIQAISVELDEIVEEDKRTTNDWK